MLYYSCNIFQQIQQDFSILDSCYWYLKQNERRIPKLKALSERALSRKSQLKKLEELSKVSVSTIKRRIAKHRGIIFTGSGFSGHWEIITIQNQVYGGCVKMNVWCSLFLFCTSPFFWQERWFSISSLKIRWFGRPIKSNC